MSFRVDTLPYTILWKRCAGTADGYAAGLNPCSDLPNPRRVEREAGRVGRIQPGAQVQFVKWIELFEGSESVERAVGEAQQDRGAQRIGEPADLV